MNNKVLLTEKVTAMCHEDKLLKHKDSIVAYLLAEIESYLDGAANINDDEDLDYYTAVQFIELKARWIQMNLSLSYQAFASGEGDPMTLLKAGATSYLLGEIESFISPKYLAEIQRLLAQPVFGEASNAA